MTDPIFVQCTGCGQTIDQLTYITPGFYRKITCSQCHTVTIVSVDKDGQVKMVKAEIFSAKGQQRPSPSKEELLIL